MTHCFSSSIIPYQSNLVGLAQCYCKATCVLRLCKSIQLYHSLSKKKKKKKILFISFALVSWGSSVLLYLLFFIFFNVYRLYNRNVEMCLGFTIASQMVYTLYLFIKTFLYFHSIPNAAKSMLEAHSGKLWCTRVPYAQC